MDKKFEKIKLIILDVDGTLTDGGIYYDSQGKEIKRFDVKDGLGIKVAIRAGIKFAIITGRESSMVIRRANELGVQYVKTGIQKKYLTYIKILQELNLRSEEVGYIGDDLNDLQVMQEVGFKACPEDATKEIKEISDYVACKKGGYGAVREGLEYLLREQNKWKQSVLELYMYEEGKDE